MQFVDKMIETREKLFELGHEAFTTSLHENLKGKTSEEIEKIKWML